MSSHKKLKQKKCKSCKEKFQPFNSLQVCCSPHCALDYAREKRARSARKALREEKQKFRDNDRSYQLKEAQKWFNACVRKRDENKTCVSCGRHHSGQYHAGHYRTVGSMPQLRFAPENCHKQCAPCNNHKSGNIVEYRIELLKRLGEEKVAWLEGHHEPKKYTIEEIRQIKKHFRKEYKRMIDENTNTFESWQ